MRRLLPLCLAGTLLLGGVAGSSTVVAPTFDALVTRAGSIFVGEVMDVRGQWRNTREGRAIFTVVTFRVFDVWKGNLGAVTQLEFLGGAVGDDELVIAGMPKFVVGQRDVLFTTSEVRVISPLVGFMHGRMRVERDISGVDRVRTFDGRPLVNPAELGPARAAGGPTGVITPMRLSEFSAAVRAHMNAARQR